MTGPYFNHLLSLYRKLNRGATRSAFVYGLASVTTQGMMMIYLVLVANWLEADRYGYIAASFAAASLTSFLFNWGLNEWMIKEGATSDDIQGLGGRVVLFKFLGGLLWGLGLWLVTRQIRPDLYLPDLTLLVILDVLFDSLFGTLIVVLILKSRVGAAAGLLSLSRIIRLVSGIALIVIGTKSVALFLLIRLACTLLMFAGTWLLARPALRPAPATGWAFKALFRESAAFNSSEVIRLIYMQVDVNLLSIFGVGRALIANYSVITGLLNAILTLPSGVHNVILPPLIRAHEKSNIRFYRNVRLVYAGFAGLAAALLVGTIFIGVPLVDWIFGSDYQKSGELLRLLSPMLALMVINQANMTYLIAVGLQVRALIPQGLTAIAKILIGVWAVARFLEYGMVGAATAAEALLLGGYLFLVLRHYAGRTRVVPA